MEIKSSVFVLVSLALLLIGCSFVFAEDAHLGNHTFEVPNGFSVNRAADNVVSLVSENNTNYSIFVSCVEIPDKDLAENSRESVGFRMVSEQSYIADNNDTVVSVQNYVRNETYFSYYSFSLDGEDFLVTYIFPVHDDIDIGEKPVDTIINSFS